MSETELPSQGPPPPLTFDEAVRNVIEGLQRTLEEFEQLRAEVPEEAYTEGEWTAIENAAGELESLVEQVQLDYEMAVYSSEAWYDVVKDVPKVTQRLGDAMLLMRTAQSRHQQVLRDQAR